MSPSRRQPRFGAFTAWVGEPGRVDLGAWRIVRRHVLTRRVSAIEALGAASVLRVDKTGR